MASIGTPGLVPDSLAQLAYCTWDELFSMPCAQAEVFQLEAARRRFEELRPRLPVLAEQADRNGVRIIETLDDLVPLLFNHSTYKSYPLSLLERHRFGQLTEWFQRTTTVDLSGVDVSGCATIDQWLDALEASTPLRVYHTSGTTGKLSFIPRTTLESDLINRIYLNIIGLGFGDEPSTPLGGPDDVRMPVIYPSVRHGRYAAQRILAHLAEVVAPTPEECYVMSDATLSAELVSLAGRIRLAQAQGTLRSMKLSDSQREALRRYLQAQEQRPREIAAFLDRLAEELRGQRVALFSAASYLFSAASAGLARGIRDVFASDSIGMFGGGGKEVSLPPDWREQIYAFSGTPTWREVYGMTELISSCPMCSQGYYHIPYHTIPFLLDPSGERPLPREGRQKGRFAAIDLLAQTYWGGVISGDMVTIDWDAACPCGRRGAYVLDTVERYSATVTGDDKISCSATIETTDSALSDLLGI